MSPANRTKPLVPYIRQSQKKEITISLDEQKRAIEKWAKDKDVKLAPAVVEQNVSGSKHWRDRELGRVVQACEDGEASGIIVAFQDRISREQGLAQAELWDALQRCDARLVCAAEGTDYRPSDDDDGELLFTVKGAIARQQWKRHRTNWKNAKHSAWERDVYVGAAPAGYSKVDGKLVPDGNGNGAAVREAFECRADGGSFGAVARILSAAGVATSHGRTVWAPMSARAVLQNETYLGVHACSCGCGESKEDKDNALIDRALFLRANRKGETKRKGAKGDGEGQMLNGLLKCGTCGYGLSFDKSTHNGKSYRYYRCKASPGCATNAVISADKVEPYIVAAVLEKVGTLHGDHAGEDDTRIAELRAGLAKAEADIAGLDAMLASDELDAVTYAKASAAAVKTRDAAAVELADIETDAVATKWYIPGPGHRDYVEGGQYTTRAVFERMPTSAQRSALGNVFVKATVTPGKGDAHERVEIEWAA
ncbi:MAG TPA: recombinase family protein [Gaiellaceae bacterium]